MLAEVWKNMNIYPWHPHNAFKTQGVTLSFSEQLNFSIFIGTTWL